MNETGKLMQGCSTNKEQQNEKKKKKNDVERDGRMSLDEDLAYEGWFFGWESQYLLQVGLGWLGLEAVRV